MKEVWVVTRRTFDGDEMQGVYASMDAVRAGELSVIRWEPASDADRNRWFGYISGQDAPEYDAECQGVIGA